MLVLFLLAWPASAQELVLRVAVLGSSSPMSYVDAKGELTGFSIGIIRAVCEELHASCQLKVVALDKVVDGLVAGEFDVAAVGLLDTPERRARILLSKPFFRSQSVWFTKNGKQPGAQGIKVAAVSGSAQEAYIRSKGWKNEPLQSNDQVGRVLMSEQADAGLVPMPTAIALMQQSGFQKLGLQFVMMDDPGLGGDVCFGLPPMQSKLKAQVDAALERIKRNGRYDRINSEFLPFRVN